MKNEKTLEELAVELEAAKSAYELIQNQYNKLEKEEADALQAKLLAEKETRYKEVIGAYDNFETLRNEFVKDYGSFSFQRTVRNPNLAQFFANFLSE